MGVTTYKVLVLLQACTLYFVSFCPFPTLSLEVVIDMEGRSLTEEITPPPVNGRNIPPFSLEAKTLEKYRVDLETVSLDGVDLSALAKAKASSNEMDDVEVCKLFRYHLVSYPQSAVDWKDYGLCLAAVSCRTIFQFGDKEEEETMLKVIGNCIEAGKRGVEMNTPPVHKDSVDSSDPTLILLREGYSAVQLAAWMGELSAQQILPVLDLFLRSYLSKDLMHSMFLSNQGLLLSKSMSIVYQDNEEVMNLFTKEYPDVGDADKERLIFMEVVNTLCATPSSVTVSLTEEERATGVILASHLSLLYGLLKLCGVVHISNAVDASVSDKLNLQVQALFDSYTPIKDLVGTSCGGVDESTCHQGERVASRDHSHTRWEMKLPVNSDYIKHGIVANNFTIPLLKAVMSSNSIEIDTFSAVLSLPSSPNQMWHQDVDPLFVHHGDMLTSANNDPVFNLPPAGIVAILPLCNVSDANGPTEFAAGTHFSNIAPWKKMWLEWNSKILESSDPGSYDDMTQLEPKVPLLSLSTTPSSVIIFDNRLVHRGRRNKSTQSRAIIYMSYLLDWFKDSVNFPDVNTKEWSLIESGRVKKLTSRLDSQEYIKVLEERLEALGVNLSDIRNVASKVKKSEMLI